MYIYKYINIKASSRWRNHPFYRISRCFVDLKPLLWQLHGPSENAEVKARLNQAPMGSKEAKEGLGTFTKLNPPRKRDLWLPKLSWSEKASEGFLFLPKVPRCKATNCCKDATSDAMDKCAPLIASWSSAKSMESDFQDLVLAWNDLPELLLDLCYSGWKSQGQMAINHKARNSSARLVLAFKADAEIILGPHLRCSDIISITQEACHFAPSCAVVISACAIAQWHKDFSAWRLVAEWQTFKSEST